MNEDQEVKIAVKEAKPLSIMIATPMYGGMCTGLYVHGLLTTMSLMRQLGVNVYWAQTMNESLITRARNDLVRLFLEQDHDLLMFIDADISFEAKAVATLLAADKDIVCGIYPKKEVDWKRIAEAALAGETQLADFAGAFVLNMVGSNHAETDETGCIEARHGGTGFMMIKRKVFEALAPHVPEYRISTVRGDDGEYVSPLVKEYFTTSIAADTALLSEDYHFCELWRRHGGKVHAHPSLGLKHVGTYVYGGDIVRAQGEVR